MFTAFEKTVESKWRIHYDLKLAKELSKARNDFDDKLLFLDQSITEKSYAIVDDRHKIELIVMPQFRKAISISMEHPPHEEVCEVNRHPVKKLFAAYDHDVSLEYIKKQCSIILAQKLIDMNMLRVENTSKPGFYTFYIKYIE